MDDNEIKEWPITCPQCGEGTVEASTKIYLDVDQARVREDGTIELVALSASHLNDYVNGIPLNVEAEMYVGCDACGVELDWDMADEFKATVAPQPIGNAPRKVGKRGGMEDNDG